MNAKVHDASSQFTEHDVSVESERIYLYPNGERLKISLPTKLFVRRDAAGDSHRVVAQDGYTYYPRRGWLGIAWKQINGKAMDF